MTSSQDELSSVTVDDDSAVSILMNKPTAKSIQVGDLIS